jgi:hypothetical protein
MLTRTDRSTLTFALRDALDAVQQANQVARKSEHWGSTTDPMCQQAMIDLQRITCRLIFLCVLAESEPGKT